MLALHITLAALLGTALVFGIIELGLVAYGVSLYTKSYTVEECTLYSCYDEHVHGSAPAITIFMLFSAIWTVLGTVVAAVLPWWYAEKKRVLVTKQMNQGCFAGLIIFYFVTMVFWLASFADIASILDGETSVFDIINAIIAFAVLLWLVFMALFILTILAVCDVLKSEWPGYLSLKETSATTTTPATESQPVPPADAEPKSEAVASE
ncbi:hypothetical protein ASPZODRAFT_127907 [Penicilliopsis zonata CBS 506.65]|uniref:MARVEL domain-containing protein n=1 Tax=Penicilliopsis zonata CBS 506.65 TaxID=1073090 RepID=A0A1L9SXA1_9EURO|nr:hypothetical protein ASPZODRAFT_127907 [Penicilliopsis zonata CBS 506.65]OJJ51776.1 hypothetical protein ASPZODRAFT_127907 [Penicilliopsis zonata CBS 506.65]